MPIVSSKLHTWIGIVGGLVLMAAPWLLSFDEHLGPRAVAVSVGLFIVLGEVLTTSPSSPLMIVPMRLHRRIDVVVGAFLAVSPWLLHFSEHGVTSWLPHLVVGILFAGHALATDTSEGVTDAGLVGQDPIDSRR